MIGESIGKNGVLLGLFAVVTTALIAVTWLGTRDRIEANQREYQARALLEVVAADRHNNSMLDDTFEVADTELLALRKPKQGYIARRDGTPVAVILPVTTREGYTGDIDLIVGINIDGTISGVRILQHRETPGLGDKVDYRKSRWVDGFIGKSLFNPQPELWKVKKDKGVFDQFTGATITPRAVIRAVRQTLEYYDANSAEILRTQIPQVSGEAGNG